MIVMPQVMVGMGVHKHVLAFMEQQWLGLAWVQKAELHPNPCEHRVLGGIGEAMAEGNKNRVFLGS